MPRSDAEVALVQDPGPCSTDEASSSPTLESVSSKELKASRMASSPSRLSSSALAEVSCPDSEAGLLALGYKQVHQCMGHVAHIHVRLYASLAPIPTASLYLLW